MHNIALENLNNINLELMNDRCIIANYFLSPLPTITNFEHTIQLKLAKKPSSKRVKDLLIIRTNKTIPITL